MITFLAGLLKGILGWLAGVLPDSPIAGWITGLDSLQLGLSWLNWFFPLGDCLVLFALYLGLLLVWAGVRMALGKGMDIAGKLI